MSLTALCTGCGAIVSNVTNQLATDLSSAILSSPDKQVVAEGLPAYLLLVDALVESNPRDKALLGTAATLNGSYAGAFLTDESRLQHFATKAKELAFRASCLHDSTLCGLEDVSFENFQKNLEALGPNDIDVLYTLGSSWAGWIQAYSGDLMAVAELPRPKMIIEKVVELDEGYSDGSALMYMGVFATLLPPALGGQPEVGRAFFERAISVSNGRNLYAKVLFAENVARPLFDRELHDQLLDDVLASEANAGDLTLQNVIAKDIASQLKASADDFF